MPTTLIALQSQTEIRQEFADFDGAMRQTLDWLESGEAEPVRIEDGKGGVLVRF